MPRQRLITLLALAIAAVTACFFFFFFSSTQTREAWRRIPQHVGLGEHVATGQDVFTAATEDPDYVNWNPRPVFKPGTPMPPGHNYTSVLVIAKTKEENIDWVADKMPHQPVAAYVVNDPNAPLHTPKNKGHEVMAYLTWIIDNYDNMPDVIMFMHAHQQAWHNDDLLDGSNYVMVTRLSRPRVWREGFVNMRCNWSPGCPDWVHPGNTKEDSGKEEEHVIAKSWSELFPLDEVPSVLSQPCCAQFALSRDRIQARPHAQYVWYRDWLLNTKLPDRVSGRVWEYIWLVFTGQNVVCPQEFLCLCDQYGLCFGGEQGFEDYMVLRNELGDREGDLRHWRDEKSRFEELEKSGKEPDENGTFWNPMGDKIEAPDPEIGKELQKEVDRLTFMVAKMKADAEEKGKDPKHRAFEAGREWREGDGI